MLRRRELDTAAATRRTADTAAQRVGAPWGQWRSIVDAAADTPSLAGELTAAGVADTRARTEDERTRAQLTAVEHERARRRALSTAAAAAEARARHQLQDQAPPRRGPTPSLSMAPTAAMVAAHNAEQLERDHQQRVQGLDHRL